MATDTITRTAHTADMADELAAGRAWPMRDALRPLTRYTAVELFQARRAFWLAAAATYAAQVAAGITDARHDLEEAQAFASVYAPRD